MQNFIFTRAGIRWFGRVVLVCLLLSSGLLMAQTRTEVKNSGKEFTYKSFDNFTSYEISKKGEVEITPDERSVKSISPGGYLYISKTTFGNKRAVKIDSDRDGKLSFQYFEGKSKEPFQGEGEAFLADVMLDVIRKTGIGAARRVERIYREKGVAGVLDEVAEIDGSGVKNDYLDLLLQQKGLTGAELIKIAARIEKEISSSSAKGRLLAENAGSFLRADKVAQAFFEAVGSISSSSETGDALRQIIREERMSDPAKISLLKAAEDISSSSEKGSVLKEFHRIFTNNPKVAGQYFEVVNSISSSSEHGSVLRELVREKNLSPINWQAFMASARQISSSSETGAVLRQAIDASFPDNSQVMDNFFEVVDNISSSSEQGAVLRKFLSTKEVSPGTAARLFVSVVKISSSSEQGSILREGVGMLGKQSATDKAFFDAAAKLSSSSEKGAVLRHALASNNLSREGLMLLLQTVKTLSSSHEAAQLLVKVAPKLDRNDQQMLEEFTEAAKSITSDSEYRRVMEAIY